MSDYSITAAVVEDPENIAAEWCALAACTDCSYFQSWGWIGNWLRQIAADLQPLLIKTFHGNEIVGLAIFVRRHVKRRLVIRSNALFLNEYPFDGRDMTMEYNGILTKPTHREAVYKEIFKFLLEADDVLDEIFLGGVVADTLPLDSLISLGKQGQTRLQILEESSTWAVNLREIGAGRDDFLTTLSRNRRTQLRRSLKLYEKNGPLSLEVAPGTDTALMFLDELKQLHTIRWQNAGKQGVFANPVWEQFHRSLIESRFHTGEIQLLRVRDDNTVIGYLYSLLWRKHVYVLQTGFQMVADKALMPGYVVHVLAIEYNRGLGMHFYDLMHGDELYKQILCSRHRQLVWLVLQRPRPRFRIERALLTVKRNLLPG